MKKYIFVLLFLLFTPVFFFGCEKENSINTYHINISFDEEENTAKVFQKLEYTNNSENAFDEIFFHVHANAFNEENIDLTVGASSFDQAFPNGKSFGSCQFFQIQVMGNDCDYSFENSGQILKIQLFETLFPDESVTIEMDYLLTFPNANHRFGYSNNSINFGNFYPSVCVYEEKEGFSKNGYSKKGDPFFSESANFFVNIECDSSLSVASSGSLLEKVEGEDKNIFSFEGEKIRDFAFVLSENFEKIEEQIDDITFSYFHLNDEDYESVFEVLKESVDFFSTTFGDYSSKNITVCQTGFVHGGMEFSDLVFISDKLLEKEEKLYVTVHEIAHQWWYSMVGNNQFEESWIDESLTEFSTALFFKHHPEFGIDYDTLVGSATKSYCEFVEIYESIYGEIDTSMTRHVDKFSTDPEYINCIYVKGVVMFDAIYQHAGEEKFLKTLKKYFEEYQFKIAKGEDVVWIFKKHCGKLAGEILQSFLDGREEIIINNHK